MECKLLRRLSALVTALALLGLATVVFAGPGGVQAVLFYSPTCGHCHYVITEVLPPLIEQYGDQLQVIGLNVSTVDGQALYQAAIERFDIADGRRGVPTLIVGETVLVGSIEIPEQLPGLIEQYLAEGGVGLPDIPGLEAALAASAAETTPEATTDASAIAASPEPGAALPSDAESGPVEGDFLFSEAPAPDDLMSKLRRDPEGNALAILLLVGIAAVLTSVARRLRPLWTRLSNVGLPANALQGWRGGAVGALCLVGLGVSFYLAYVETTHTTAVCGPIGDCNTVQQSAYAVLFGLVPVGVLGVVGYAVMLAAWAGALWGRGRLQWLAESALAAMALFGTLFSAYLTFLEPFVIGATCAWCLTSALSMTLILLLVMDSIPAPGRQAARA